MANIYDSSAMSALNEDDYINKLYDTSLEAQKKSLQQGYDDSVKQITGGQQNTQNQTEEYLKRSYVEGQRSADYIENSMPSLSSSGEVNAGASAQARLSLGNQQQKTVSSINNQLEILDQEYERQRKLLAEKYESQIKQAQANNDMVRAQALYAAAQAEDEQLRALRLSAATILQQRGDNSLIDAIGKGEAVERDTKSKTWNEVLKYEDSINKIYDAEIESARQQAQLAHNIEMSDLQAQQEETARETDTNLTKAYVEALLKNKNYQEVQNAYGQGSGSSVRARLARENGLIDKLTSLRTGQMEKDAKSEVKKTDSVYALGEKIATAQKTADEKRNAALYEAAEKEEQALVEEQKVIGQLLANQNNWSVLGKLYGLTQDQIDRLQGTGIYASGGGGGGGGGDYYEPAPAPIPAPIKKVYEELISPATTYIPGYGKFVF